MTCPSCQSEQHPDATYCTACGAELIIAPPAVELPSAAFRPRRTMSRRTKLIYLAAALTVCAIFVYLFQQHLPGGSHPVIAAQPDVAMATMYMGKTIAQQNIDVEIRDGVVSFPLAVLLEKKIVAFDYPMATRTVPLLAYVSTDGKLVTAVRMCEPCNSQTFTIDGSEMVCGRCGTRWKLTNLEGIEGACQKYPPDPIPSTVVGNTVQIKESVIQQWKMRI